MEENSDIQNHILTEIQRISKNIQFFFWLTIISMSFSLLIMLYSVGIIKTYDEEDTEESAAEEEPAPAEDASYEWTDY